MKYTVVENQEVNQEKKKEMVQVAERREETATLEWNQKRGDGNQLNLK